MGRTHASSRSGLAGIFAHDAQFVRFYPDGTFVETLIKGAVGPDDAAAIAQWFVRDVPRAGVRQGRYRFVGGRLEFETRGPFSDGEPTLYSGVYAAGAWVFDVLDRKSGRRRAGVTYRAIGHGAGR